MQAATVGHHCWHRVSTVGTQTPAQAMPEKFEVGIHARHGHGCAGGELKILSDYWVPSHDVEHFLLSPASQVGACGSGDESFQSAPESLGMQRNDVLSL